MRWFRRREAPSPPPPAPPLAPRRGPRPADEPPPPPPANLARAGKVTRRKGGRIPGDPFAFTASWEQIQGTAHDGSPLIGWGLDVLPGDVANIQRKGGFVVSVAGVQHRPQALQDARIRAGEPLLLRREPDNPHDANAVSVWDAEGEVQVGFIPREHAAAISAGIAAGSLETRALCLWEWRSAEGERLSLKMLVASGPIEWRERESRR